jgi:hypothetical protein
MQPQDVDLKEYETLRAETITRVGFRDNITYVSLGVIGAMAAYVLGGDSTEARDREMVLLLVPWPMLVLGWLFVHNDFKINQISDYIKVELAKRLRKNFEGHQLLGWDEYYRSGGIRVFRKIFQTMINAMLFAGSGAAALWWYESRNDLRTLHDRTETVFWASTGVVAITFAMVVLLSDVIGFGLATDGWCKRFLTGTWQWCTASLNASALWIGKLFRRQPDQPRPGD